MWVQKDIIITGVFLVLGVSERCGDLAMKRKVSMRLLCFLLAGMMTVTSVQLPAYAAEVTVEQESDTSEVTAEGEKEVRTNAEEAGKAPGEFVTETEKTDGSADLGSDSMSAEDTEAGEAAAPAIPDAVVSEPVESVEPEETVIPEEPADSVEITDADSVVTKAPDGEPAAAEVEEEEIPEAEVLQDDTPAPTYAFTPPTNRTYFVGVGIDVTGAKIVKTTGTTIENIDVTSSMITGYNENTEGMQSVGIQYQDGTATVTSKPFDVLVIQKPGALSIDFGEDLSTILPTSSFGTWAWGANVPATAGRAGKQTYELKFRPTNSGTFKELTIEKQEVNVTCDLNSRDDVTVELSGAGLSHDEGTYSTTYDGTAKKPTVAVSVGGVALRPTTDFRVTYGDNIKAGNGTVTVTGAGTSATGCVGTKTVTFTIEKAKLQITAVSQGISFKNKDNDDGTTTTYIIKNDDTVEVYNKDTTKPEFDYTVSGLAAADRDSGTGKGKPGIIDIDVVYECMYNLTRPGDYTISLKSVSITGTASDNYALDNIEKINGTLRVSQFTPTAVRISGVNSGLNKEYDEKQWPYGDNARVVFGNGNNVPDITATASYSGTLWDGTAYPENDAGTAEAPTEAGDYTVTFELEERPTDHKDELYALEGAIYTFSITRKVLTITAGSYHVAAGETVPEITDEKNELIEKLLEKDKKYYTVEGFLDKDKNNLTKQKQILNTEDLTLRYEEGGISENRAGTYAIVPYGAELRDKDADGNPYNPSNKYTNNYEITYVPGVLTVEGRKKYEYDFTSITVADMTYSSQPHSISGYATGGTETYKIIVTGEVRKEGYEKIDDDWDSEDDPEDTRNNNYKRKSVKVPVGSIVEEYQKIAPTEVGDYTVRIFSEINDEKNVYDYDGEALVDRDFQILPLKAYQMKLVGVTGVANKVYNGAVTDLSEPIKNARVWTEQDIDITDLVKPEFYIREVIPVNGTGSGYEETVFDQKNPDKSKMPADAGEYELVVKIMEDVSENYVTNEWRIPFVIKKRPLTVTVVDKKIPVNPDGDGTLPADLEYEYVITDETITDETKKVLNNEDFEKPLIEPAGEVDTRETGSYDLNASGKIGSIDKSDGKNYDITYVSGKLYVQTKLWGVKELDLTNNKNIPHGKTLEEIAAGYLPKTVVIYLNEDKTVEDTAAITWDTKELVSGGYNINSKAAQNFRMRGTLVLPDMVYIDKADEDKGWLTVTVDVSVREADDGSQAKKPYADIKSGTVGAGTRVSLSTDEEGAQIYYTIEADNPSLSVTSRRYTGPIEIKCTMIIRAVSRVYGKLDSEELYLSYYYNKNSKPGGDDDPDDPNNPQVPDEDIPKDENGNPIEIPKGMWVTDVAQYTYSGTAIKPQVKVYDYKTRLEENKDYTVSYKNNINAADKNDPRKAPAIVIKGKGNYEGKIDKTFTIAPKNINDVHEENSRQVYDVKMDDITVDFVDKKAQKPVVAVSWNGKKLVNKKDFTFEDTPYTEVGTYPVKVTGNGNYTGERKISFIITRAIPAAKFTVSKIADYNYTGQEIRPTVIVTYQKAVLQQGLEYTVTYEDNKEIGTASAVIKGMGRFAGVKRVNFKIKAAAVLNKAQVELAFNSGANVYTGKEIKPDLIKMSVRVENNGAVETRVLTENDYKVSYQNNVKAGTATAVFEGVGAYSGTLKKTFKILPYNLQDIQPDQITTQAAYPYMQGGSQQKPVVLFDGKALQEGTDYSLSYRNNKRVGGTAIMTIKGKGNFTGSIVRTYQVTIRDISDMTVIPVDKVYQPKVKNYTTRVRVVDSNGKGLVAGEDYDGHFTYSYAEKITLESGEVKNPGELVADRERVPAGARIRVTVTAIGKNYQGTAFGTFKIVQADVAKTKITVPTMTYTGKPIEPKQSDITVTLNGIPLTANDYKIIEYSNNLNTGTAKLTIQGQGHYGGKKTVSFKIKKKGLIAQLF